MRNVVASGKKFVLVCEHLDYKGNVPKNLILYIRKNIVDIESDDKSFNVVIDNIVNKKTITISSEENTDFYDFYGVAMDILRHENLYEGIFFPIKSCILDGVEYYDKVENEIIGYIKSCKNSAFFKLPEDDEEYAKSFENFRIYLKDNILRHHIYLYAVFLMGAPVDLRMAQMLEIFEPIADELKGNGRISFLPEKNNRNVVCPNCNTIIPLNGKRKITLKEKLFALIGLYGVEIFDGEDIETIVEKAVAVRNKVDHVTEKSKAMNGIECGTYLYKFSMMYRMYVFEKMGLLDEKFINTMKVQLNQFNYQYEQYRII